MAQHAMVMIVTHSKYTAQLLGSFQRAGRFPEGQREPDAEARWACHRLCRLEKARTSKALASSGWHVLQCRAMTSTRQSSLSQITAAMGSTNDISTERSLVSGTSRRWTTFIRGTHAFFRRDRR